MATISRDTFTGTNWDDIDERQGELGAVWTKHVSTPDARFYLFDNKVHCGQITSGAGALFYTNAVPSSANYTVSCSYTMKTNIGHVGIAGRIQTGSLDYYFTYYDPSNVLVLARRSPSGITILANSNAGTISVGATVTLALDMNGTTIRALVNDVQIYSVTDSGISLAGRGGVRSGSVNDAHTGKHIDNFTIVDASVAPTTRRTHVVLSGL